MPARKLVAPILLLLTVAACGHAPPNTTPSPVSQANTAPTASPSQPETPRRGGDGAILAGETRDRELATARAALTQAIYFDFDSATIRDDQRTALENKIPVLSRNPALRVRVEGNTDERGSSEYNIALGMRRAAQAKRFLTDRGIDASRIDVISYGEERPVCSTSDEPCWQQNRRDNFTITAGDITKP
jgi:peptidoglycan-associated lipoprotein